VNLKTIITAAMLLAATAAHAVKKNDTTSELTVQAETKGDAISRGIAQELTSRNMPTLRGGDVWSPMTVMRAMKRLGIAGR
jgi:hypothetical protein